MLRVPSGGSCTYRRPPKGSRSQLEQIIEDNLLVQNDRPMELRTESHGTMQFRDAGNMRGMIAGRRGIPSR